MSTVGAALRNARRRLFDGLLGVPVVYIVGGALLASLVIPLSAVLSGVPDLATVEIARSTLPTIGGATLSLAGFVLTITTLALQFGASTYAPRLVDQLRRDRLLRHTLGTALGTFTYAVVVLFTMRTSHPATATIATVVAVAGSTATVLLFIALLERLIGSLRPGRVLAGLASTACELATTAYADECTNHDGTPQSESGTGQLPDAAVVDWNIIGTTGALWRHGPRGHLVDVDVDTLTVVAAQSGALLTLTCPVGSFLQDREIVAVVQDAGTGVARPLDPPLGDLILAAITVGEERTMDADPSFPLRLIVDAALRALSPGVNDPTTAAQALEHIEQILLTLAGRRLSTQTVHDELGVARVRIPAPGWEALLDLGYTEIIAAGDDPQTRRALARSLRRLGARVPEARRAAVERLASDASGEGVSLA